MPPRKLSLRRLFRRFRKSTRSKTKSPAQSIDNDKNKIFPSTQDPQLSPPPKQDSQVNSEKTESSDSVSSQVNNHQSNKSLEDSKEVQIPGASEKENQLNNQKQVDVTTVNPQKDKVPISNSTQPGASLQISDTAQALNAPKKVTQANRKENETVPSVPSEASKAKNQDSTKKKSLPLNETEGAEVTEFEKISSRILSAKKKNDDSSQGTPNENPEQKTTKSTKYYKTRSGNKYCTDRECSRLRDVRAKISFDEITPKHIPCTMCVKEW